MGIADVAIVTFVLQYRILDVVALIFYHVVSDLHYLYTIISTKFRIAVLLFTMY
jgi:hypothetical protein